MSLRTRLSLLVFTLTLVSLVAIPASRAAAAPSTSAPPAALATGAATPAAQETGPAELSLSYPLLGLSRPAPQYSILGCPIESLFSAEAPSDACSDGGVICTQLCGEGGGTYLVAVTKTGADCTCLCCSS
jgi:hypothetical protein